MNQRILGKTAICLVDVETTGFSSKEHEITEVAAILVDEQLEIIDEIETLVLISKGVPWHISRLTGITDRILREKGRKLPDSLKTLHGFTTTRPMFAHNARFDSGFLNHHSLQMDLGLHFPLECTIPTFKRLLPNQKGYGLSVLAEALGVKNDGAHRALADCRMLLECLKRAWLP